MKAALLEIEALLSNATAELSLPHPKLENVKRGIEVAQKMLLELAEDQSGQEALSKAKHNLALIYLGMPESQFSETDAQLFSVLSKDRQLQTELDRARKNN